TATKSEDAGQNPIFDYALDGFYQIFGEKLLNPKYDVGASIMLSQWIYELNQVIDSRIVDSAVKNGFNFSNPFAFKTGKSKNSEKYAALWQSIKNVQDADNYLYNEIKIYNDKDNKDEKKSLSDWVNDVQSDMFNQSSIKDFKVHLERAKMIKSR